MGTWHFSPLHDAVWIQVDGLKRAELHEGHLLVRSTVPCPLGTQGTVEEELSMSISNQAAPCKSKSVFMSNDSTGFGCWGRAPVTPHRPAHSKISYMISYVIAHLIYDIIQETLISY